MEVTTVTSNGYNVVDQDFGTGNSQSGWVAAPGDKRITSLPISPTTFRLITGGEAVNVITTLPENYPLVDFYGDSINNGAAPGAVQSFISGYTLDQTVNNSTWGSMSVSPGPDENGLFSGTVELTAQAADSCTFLHWIINGENAGSSNPLTFNITENTTVQAVFGLTFIVSSLSDAAGSVNVPGTLRNAIANAPDGQIIGFSDAIALGTIELTSRLEINKNLVIEGKGIRLTRSSSWTVEDANSQFIYISNSDAVVHVSRMWFTGGRARGYNVAAAIQNIGSLTLESCIFDDNLNTQLGGISEISAVISSSGPITVIGCTFGNNINTAGGVILLQANANLSLAGNMFFENSSTVYSGDPGYVQLVLNHGSGSVVSGGYNLADVSYGLTRGQSGFTAETGDLRFADIGILGFPVSAIRPVNISTFAPNDGRINIVTSELSGFPNTDFYGNPRISPGAAGAVNTSDIPATSINLNKNNLTLYIGETETLVATVGPVSSTNKNVSWTSSNTNAATVDNNGTVTAIAVGATTITASTATGITVECEVNVMLPVISVSLNKNNLAMTVGDTDTLVATVHPDDATDKSVSWASSNKAVVTIDDTGFLIAVGPGTATITVTTTDGGKTAECTVVVQQIAELISVTADGSFTATSTRLTLTFDADIVGLTIDNITVIPGTTGALKGELKAHGGGIYELTLSGISASGQITIAVANPELVIIAGSQKTVQVYFTVSGSIGITFNQISDNAPLITGPTIYRVSNSGPTTAIITVENPEQYDDIRWRVQNTVVTGTGASFTLDAANPAYNLIGEHLITVFVIKDGVPYSKNVSFYVAY